MYARHRRRNTRKAESKPHQYLGRHDGILTRPAPDLSAEERAEVKKVARVLLERLSELLILNWRQNTVARARLKLGIEDALDDGLPAAYGKEWYEQKCAALFEHVFESYPGAA